jgi:hypothetical protein
VNQFRFQFSTTVFFFFLKKKKRYALASHVTYLLWVRTSITKVMTTTRSDCQIERRAPKKEKEKIFNVKVLICDNKNIMILRILSISGVALL